MASTQPLVSILIPLYNSELWIADTLRSALAQSWENKEIIVVDDGSKDQSLAVAQQFASEIVTVVTQKNQGAAAARNKAYSISRGDFIQWLDADDFLSPTKIERQMAAYSQNSDKSLLLSSGWAYFIFRPRKTVFTPSSLWRDLSPAEWLICKIGQNLHMQTATWLVSRELTEKAGPWDTRLLGDDDGEYFCRVLLASKGVKFVAGPGVYYRSAGTSSLSYIGRSNKKIEAQFLSMKMTIDYLHSVEISPRVREACVRYLNNWSIHFYPERIDLFEKMKSLAEGLGGKLEIPSLSWKYSWIRALFGWKAAKRIQVLAPSLRWNLTRKFDKFMADREGPIAVDKLP